MRLAHPVDRIFIFAAVGIALASWQFGFNIGAYETIFFEHVFGIWVASMAVLLACLILPLERRPIGKMGLLALASPTLWIVSQVMSYASNGAFAWLSFFIGTGVLVIALPYVAFVLISITQTEGQALRSRRHLTGLVAIAFAMGTLGLTVGDNHFYLLSCDDFVRAGAYVPDNCWSATQP